LRIVASHGEKSSNQKHGALTVVDCCVKVVVLIKTYGCAAAATLNVNSTRLLLGASSTGPPSAAGLTPVPSSIQPDAGGPLGAAITPALVVVYTAPPFPVV
jgi:hypothetical protein